jgi:hypothetical protein
LHPTEFCQSATVDRSHKITTFSQVTRYNIAYFSFMVLGAISFWTAYLTYTELKAAGGETSGVDGVLGFLVFLPLGIPILLALIFGPGFSIVMGRDSRLMTLTVLTLVLIFALVISGYTTWPLPLFPYAAICWVVDFLWLIKYRRRFEGLSDSAKSNESS